jgi:NAD(P)-dependent dehydrogenase (short-subunit alcohol dehydrogenase family)
MNTAKLPDSFSPEPGSLKDKVILVTGATGGYGKAISQIYAEAGATVILLGKNVRLLENLYDEIENAGYPTPAIYPLNLEGAVEKDYYDMAQNIEKEFGRLDGLIHTAAVLGTRTPFTHSETDNWYKVMQINLNGPYMMTKHCIPLMKKSEHASIIFMTDSKIGAYWDAYSVSKQGLNALMENLAAEFEGSNLHVNSFNPGPSKTRLQIQAYPAATDNDSLPEPLDHKTLLLYMMSNQQMKNGVHFMA